MLVTKTIGLASIRTKPDADIASHYVGGVVTPRNIGGLVTSACEVQSLAMVVSYESAVVAIQPDAMFASAWRPGGRTFTLEQPAALVVRPDQLSVFREYARTALSHGVIRAAFTSAEQAFRWAAEQAEVQAHLIEAVRRLKASEESLRTSSAAR